MKKLLVISNHSPEKWESEQKAGWDIEYMPFPEVPPEIDMEEVKEIGKPIIKEILDFTRKNPEGKVCIQGEFSLCSYIYRMLPEDFFVFPTTKRVVEETKEGLRLYKFKFVRWR